MSTLVTDACASESAGPLGSHLPHRPSLPERSRYPDESERDFVSPVEQKSIAHRRHKSCRLTEKVFHSQRSATTDRCKTSIPPERNYPRTFLFHQRMVVPLVLSFSWVTGRFPEERYKRSRSGKAAYSGAPGSRQHFQYFSDPWPPGLWVRRMPVGGSTYPTQSC